MSIRSGDVIRLAAGLNNTAGFKSLHLIHPDLFIYRHFGAADMTFVKQEETALGGDRRLFAIALGRGSLALPFMTQAALAAILTHVSLTNMDAPVTVRFWDKVRFRDYNAILQYLPPADLQTDFCSVFAAQFNLIDMVEVVS